MDSTSTSTASSRRPIPYGYTGFAGRPDRRAHTDGHAERLAVKVNNQLPSSRWYSGSGIYRNVHLVVTDPVHVARHGVFVTTPTSCATRSATATPTCTCRRGRRRGAGARASRPSATRAAASSRAASGAGPTCASATRTCGRPRTRTCTRCETRVARRRPRARPRRARVRHPLVPLRPERGPLAQRRAHEALRRRPAPRPGRARRGDQPRRARAPDEDHEEHGRQRAPDVPQPAVARDDRRLPAARDRDDGRGVRHLAHARRCRSTTGASSTPTATPTSRRWSTRPRTRRR